MLLNTNWDGGGKKSSKLCTKSYINRAIHTEISFLQVTGDVEMKLDIDKEIKKQEDIELEASENS